MIDINLVRNNPEIIVKDLKKRKQELLIPKIEEIKTLDNKWKRVQKEVENLRKERNQISKKISVLKKEKKDATNELLAAKNIPEKIKQKEEEAITLISKRNEILQLLPNILHNSVPIGESDDDNEVIKEYGEKPSFSFKIRNHVDILERNDLLDTDKAGQVAGSRFYYLKSDMVFLDLALTKFALDILAKEGFIPLQPPYMLRRKAYETMVSMEDFKDVMYKIEEEDLYLIATSEHPIGVYHLNENITLKKPLKYAGLSPCFRKEAGTHGKNTKGIFRVHHFNKIEQFIFCKEEDSWAMHEYLLEVSEKIFELLKIPYRIVNVCTGDIGNIAAKKYDIEAWMPAQNKYREVVSCSNCTDYQARKLFVRYQNKNKLLFAHTLNSTALAISRTMVAIIENNQQKDGRFRIPEVLVPYMNGKTMIGK